MPGVLGLGAGEQPQRDVRRALGQRAPARARQDLRRPRVVRRLGREQVRGDDAVQRAVRVQQPRRLAVQARALGAQVGLHRLAHHRVHEARVLRVDQVRVGERAQLPRRLGLAELGERRDAREARRVPEHGGRAGDGERRGGERADAGRDRRAARSCGRRRPRRRGRGTAPRCSSSVSSSGLPRVVSKHAVHERRLGVELGLHERGDARLGERLRAVQARHRRGREPVQQRLLGARLGGPRADRQQHRQVLHPARERVQEAQARRVRPVRVVDHDQQRLLGRQVRREPVEPVQRRVRRVLRRPRVRGGEHRLGEPRGAREQPRRGAPRRRRAARRRRAGARSRTRSRAPAARPWRVRTLKPCSAASARRTRSSDVLPCPAGASSSATDPAAARAACSCAARPASSAPRSSSVLGPSVDHWPKG